MKKQIKELIENVKNHNFDNGNFVIEQDVEISFDGDNFKYELPNEIITLSSLEEIVDYI